ncbi:MAG: ABC transporter ATP-binding protein, partial [Lachnospiraceae bacterium]|nr:ABC transporter ATP-binding protein [Lachnospiraceae bacterium]
MLQIKDIHKQYKTGDLVQKALDGVSLTFRDNEFVAILGPSGSGKTTLLNIIGGLDRYDSGDLVISGVSTKEYTDRDWDTYRNHSIGFVFQSYNLISHQTVLQNVELALTISGISKAERRKKSIEALQKVGLGEQLGKHPNQMSGGQMQRVAIARALVNDPEILLADEPTGALDTQTGIQVMELLKEVAEDRLVIMVTHNPELARQYATRIVNLRDGKIMDDSNPADGDEIALRKPDKVRKSSMSFRTSLGLSFRNLLTKKRRTLMTAAAGSIGIIGIALILALSSGVNEYIQSVEEDTLAEYPLQITSSEFDVASLLATMSDTADMAGDDTDNEAEISVTEIISTLLSQMNSNDLASLKEYIESGESRLLEYVTAIEYIYDLEPEIYLSEDDSWRRVNPDSSLSVSGNSIFSMFMSSSGVSSFYAMPESESLYKDQYEVMAGHWPESYNECVLVLTSTGSISDYMLYTLGLRDYTELEDMLRQYSNGEDVNGLEDIESYFYEDVLGITFKVVCSADYYAYDSEYGVWVDKTDNKDYLTELVENGEDLTIVGVVQPAEGSVSAALSSGINYPRSLIYHMSELSKESEAVQAQLANPDVNIFTGEPFGEDTEDFDMSSILSINEEVLESLLDISSLTDSLSLDLSSFDFDTSSLRIDLSTLELDFSSLDLDLDPDALNLSLFDFDIDTDSLNLSDYLDFSTVDFSTVDTGSLEEYLSDLDISEILEGLTIDIPAESMNSLAEELLTGYQTWLVEGLVEEDDFNML